MNALPPALSVGGGEAALRDNPSADAAEGGQSVWRPWFDRFFKASGRFGRSTAGLSGASPAGAGSSGVKPQPDGSAAAQSQASPEPASLGQASPEPSLPEEPLPKQPLPKRPLPEASSLSSSESERGPEKKPETSPEKKVDLGQLLEPYGLAGLLAQLEALTQAQGFQLEQHRDSLARAQAEQAQQQQNWRSRCALLEAQLAEARDRAATLETDCLNALTQSLPIQAERDQAQAQVDRLREKLRDQRQHLEALEGQIEQSGTSLQEQQVLIQAQTRELMTLRGELSRSQAQVEALEMRLSHQGHLQRQLKGYADQDRLKRDRARDRQLQLEQDSTELNAQLLSLGEQLRNAQAQSSQWRRQALGNREQLQAIAQWAAGLDSAPLG
ncbi:MAG: hypothetical protein HC824_17195 [Synechococcales cyanobacterium RM1_1_8]|nr:hypothetical protein [Synechococcales cyanobacterium RM1_1_8]